MKTTIYRVQHRTLEHGPWCAEGNILTPEFWSINKRMAIVRVANFLNARTGGETHYNRIHPSVHDDFGWRWNNRKLCAAPTLELIKSWFNFGAELVQLFEEAGFALYEITIDSELVQHSKSGRQCAYDQDDEIIMTELDLNILA